MKKIHTLFFLFVLLSNYHGSAQEADSALTKLAIQAPVEKIYVHYDKEYYVTGETIWFKAYFFSGGKPSGLSNNFYLQFTDNKGKIIRSNRYPVMGAVAKGNIAIPDSLPQGNYYIRAFTPGMLNGEESLLYTKNIYIFKPAAQKPTTSSAPTISVQFFPESGDLVDGIITITGFKATDQWGQPVEIKGIIRTEDGTTIAPFASYHDGMGRVSFKPVAGKKYIAEVETAAGPRTFSLPEVKASGINLKIQDEKGGKKFQLSRGEKDKAAFDNLLLVAQINNQVVFENEIAFEDYPSVIGHLVTDSLPSGILHFTVFNKNGLPIAERLAFIDNGEYKTTTAFTAGKLSGEKRAVNEFAIDFPDAIQRSCSVSVTDMSSFSFNDNESIYSRFLLTSDLKGYIFNPAWYFENSNDSIRIAFDNLMMTQGWSRFNWSKILEGQYPDKKFKDQPFIFVSGIVKDEKNKEPYSGGKLNFYIETEDSSKTSYEVLVNTKGEFMMDSLIFSGHSKFYYVYTDTREKVRPAVITGMVNEYDNAIAAFPSFVPDNSMQKNAISQNKGEMDTRHNYVQSQMDEYKELEKVTLLAKSKKRPLDVVNEKYTNGVFRSQGDATLDNINEPANDKSLSVVDYIKNSIQAVEVQNGQFVNRKNFSLMSGQKWPIGVFLNESPVNMALLRPVRMQDVALIKFFEAGFVGVGSSFPGGALAVYTKEKFKEEEKPEKLSFFEYAGYTLTKEFYNPDYNIVGAKPPASDNRTTLYWNPDAGTNSENKTVSIRFFNNDFSKKFKVVMEGFDANGKLVHVEKVVGN